MIYYLQCYTKRAYFREKKIQQGKENITNRANKRNDSGYEKKKITNWTTKDWARISNKNRRQTIW